MLSRGVSSPIMFLILVTFTTLAPGVLSLPAVSSFPLSLALRDPLPDSAVGLNTTAGAALLKSALSASFLPLAMAYVTQETQAFCSIASTTIVLNAADVAAPIDPIFAPHAYFTQDALLKNTCVSKLFNKTYIDYNGLTLDQAAQVSGCYKSIAVSTTHAADSTLATFREQLKAVAQTAGVYMISNFARQGLEEHGGGHFSPLGAYNEANDAVLVMDVARYKYPAFWVPVAELFAAMNTIDTTSKKSRGWLAIQLVSTD